MIFPPAADGGDGSTEEPRKPNMAWLNLLVQCLNNLAASHLQNGEALRARDACIKALEYSPENVTTLLRAGRCVVTSINLR
jgi:hypothetical protein